MKFDVILTNPPFQDSENRGKTPHKLWIEFTLRHFEKFLRDGGLLGQVSPSSFQSPSSKVLELFREKHVIWIDLTSSKYFPEVGSSFSHYLVKNEPRKKRSTKFITKEGIFSLQLDNFISYLPNDLCSTSISIHKKFIFSTTEKLKVEWDYVTCHNILLRREGTVSKKQTDEHKYPVFHTNSQIWWSSKRQEWADCKKVMWSRSGYFKPIYDPGKLGGTDMAYFVKVNSDRAGKALSHNLNLNLPKYVMKTAKWSGFGNEIVFSLLPKLPDKKLSNEEIYTIFDLHSEEVDHVEKSLQRARKKTQ